MCTGKEACQGCKIQTNLETQPQNNRSSALHDPRGKTDECNQ